MSACPVLVRLVQRPRENSLDPTVYEVTTEAGVWLVIKEFYAAGPSLFTWVVYQGTHAVAEFRTKRAALAYIAKIND